MTELAADVDQVVAAAAMIGGISYFHEFAFDLLAENERILASTFEAAIASHKAGRLQPDRRAVELDGVRVDDGLPDARGRRADVAAADLHVRLPEARVRVLRARRLGAVPAAVHDPAAVQLRGHRGAPGGPRHRRHERQREARPVARGPGPRAQGAQGPGPAAHPGRRVAGPALHVRRRPRARDPARDGVGRRGQRRLQPLDGGVDDRPRARRGDLERGPRRRPAVPLRLGPAVRARRPAPRPRRAQGVATCSGSRRRPASTRCWTRSSRGSATSSRRDGCDRALGRRPGVQGGRGGRARPAGARRRDRDRRTRSSSSTTSTRTRPSPSSSGSTRSCRRSAACATTSGGACSTR